MNDKRNLSQGLLENIFYAIIDLLHRFRSRMSSLVETNLYSYIFGRLTLSL